MKQPASVQCSTIQGLKLVNLPDKAFSKLRAREAEQTLKICFLTSSRRIIQKLSSLTLINTCCLWGIICCRTSAAGGSIRGNGLGADGPASCLWFPRVISSRRNLGFIPLNTSSCTWTLLATHPNDHVWREAIKGQCLLSASPTKSESRL